MSFKNFPVPPIPSRKQIVQVDPIEFSALRTVVIAMFGMLAAQREAAGQGSAQSFVNLIAEISSEIVPKISISGSADGAARLRETMLKEINNILGSISFPRDGNNTH